MNKSTQSAELATFTIGEALCGLDILNIQEINKPADMTRVPQAPPYVLGILNLRGQIVTVIDIGQKLGLDTTTTSDDPRTIIVRTQEGHVGLLVSSIGDVISVDEEHRSPPPANMNGIQDEFFTGVYRQQKTLIGTLDIQKVLSVE